MVNACEKSLNKICKSSCAGTCRIYSKHRSVMVSIKGGCTATYIHQALLLLSLCEDFFYAVQQTLHLGLLTPATSARFPTADPSVGFSYTSMEISPSIQNAHQSLSRRHNKPVKLQNSVLIRHCKRLRIFALLL